MSKIKEISDQVVLKQIATKAADDILEVFAIELLKQAVSVVRNSSTIDQACENLLTHFEISIDE